MTRYISENQTQEELQSCYRPTVLDSSFSILPFNNLGDREFELLSYLLVKEEIKLQLHSDLTQIALMQGVGERGRDCVLYNDGKVCGLIQCKKHKGRLTLPVLLKELIKFALYANQDSSILPDIENFQYFIFISSDFTEPANNLLHNYKTSIANEIENNNIKSYMEQVVSEYESFIKERHNLPSEKIYSILTNLKVVAVNGVDLTARINNVPTILQNFFNVKTVVSLVDADQLVRQALDDYGLRYLTDEDLKYIQERISSTTPDQRVGLGIVDFYGYNVDFFKNLRLEEYKEILDLAVKLKSILYKKLMDFIQKKVHELIQKEVTQKLLKTDKIHTISVGLCAPYLFKRMINRINKNELPDFLFEDLGTSEDVITKEVAILLATTKKIMDGDYSELEGDESLVNLKIDILKHSHRGLIDIKQAEQQIQKDVLIMKPILQSMEEELGQMISEKRTILISDQSFFKDPGRLKSILDKCSQIGNLS